MDAFVKPSKKNFLLPPQLHCLTPPIIDFTVEFLHSSFLKVSFMCRVDTFNTFSITLYIAILSEQKWEKFIIIMELILFSMT